MNILFLSISTAVSNIHNRGIYPDLLRHFVKQGHEVFIVCPFERRTGKKTNLHEEKNIHILGVRTLNITKSNFLEKGIATIFIESQFKRAINKYFQSIPFDLILYSTPPITFNNLITSLKQKHSSRTYLMLKDIFPQNAIDLGLMRSGGILHNYFRKKEKGLYAISDHIGCMSPANVHYILSHNPELNPAKIGICPNAIEIKERNNREEKSQILLKYDIPSGQPIFMYGGNLGIAQGIDFLIQILESNQKRKDVFFLIVGSGNRSGLITDWINTHKNSNVRYISTLNRLEYDQLEACCDVGMIFLNQKFSIPNFPSRMLAYMEAKLPILIVSDRNSDAGKIAEENRFGKWSLAGDLETFNKNMDFFLKNSDIRMEMGEHGLNYLLNNYIVSHAYNAIMNETLFIKNEK